MRNFLTAGALALATVIAVSWGFAGDALARGGGGGGHGGGGGGVHIGGGGGFHGGGMGSGFHGGGMAHFGGFGGGSVVRSGHDRTRFGGGWWANDCGYSPYNYPNNTWCTY